MDDGVSNGSRWNLRIGLSVETRYQRMTIVAMKANRIRQDDVRFEHIANLAEFCLESGYSVLGVVCQLKIDLQP